MKYSYTYSGSQAAFVFSGLAVLPAGVPTSIDADVHKKLQDNKFAQHLIESGEIDVQEIDEPSKSKSTSGTGVRSTGGKGKQNDAAADAAKAADDAQKAALDAIKAELKELGVTFSDDEKLEQLQAKLAQAKE
ncbi:hypothetical protein; putative signal peptide [Acinetobacter proteolyticus]|uniref:Uncharacterized protein n=1 Tax=Acinetobacter proteolyticus TaxID=1776741 RepID=A0A653K3L5_9GAMM|nr:hypothetical protein [Acinetobacter proteolyticus]VXA55437.1 hypothetical protein; putative signal peptide [Acinetobacter proteolyticus]